MSDNFVEVTNQSWFSRLGGAFKGIIVGLILFIAAFPLLFWNEGRAVKRYKTLKEGSGAVISIAVDSVNSENEGKLVHVAGTAKTADTLEDNVFGISSNSIKLRRNVEMYQWKEKTITKKKKKIGGGTKTTKTYSYSKIWSERVIDSTNFKKPEGHENPGQMLYESTEKVATVVNLGVFELSPSLVGKIGGYSVLPVESSTLENNPELEGLKVVSGKYYKGANPSSPRIGDLKILFEVVNNTDVSLISAQSGNTFKPYQTEAGGTIELLEMGNHSAKEMFKNAQNSNVILTWILRLVGFLMMFIGLSMMFKVLSVIADVLPILGSIVSAGTGIIAFLIALVFASLTIAIAWIVYRPLLGILLIVIVVVVVFVIGKKLKK